MATIKVKRILYIEWYVTNIVQASFFYISSFVFKGLRNDCIDSSIRKVEEPINLVFQHHGSIKCIQTLVLIIKLFHLFPSLHQVVESLTLR